MKRYTTPKITSDSLEEGSFAIPFIAGFIAAAVATKVASKAVDAISKADTLIVGGGMSYTFAKAQGYEIGKSVLEGGK